MTSKRVAKLKQKIEPEKTYSFDEAIKLVKETSTVKFDASVEVHARLGIDPSKTDQKVRAMYSLPHSIGKEVKIAVFAEGEKEKEAKEAGADLVGSDALIGEIKKTGKVDFDVAIATPDMMKKLAQIAKILGPKGMMPNPKTDTITMDVGRAVAEMKKGKYEVRSDEQGNAHAVIGKVSFEDDKLEENFSAFMEALKGARPDKMKGEYMLNLVLASTMGPSVKVSV